MNPCDLKVCIFYSAIEEKAFTSNIERTEGEYITDFQSCIAIALYSTLKSRFKTFINMFGMKVIKTVEK
ncbi:MAG: hypothetical protein ACTSUE_24400 [Promethearchaeota archaeon]